MLGESGVPGSGWVFSLEFTVDGGAAANDLLMQFQADLLGVPVVRPKVLETTALGAAYLAGLTTSLWKSKEEIASHWRAQHRFEPQMSRATAAEKMARWREAVSGSRRGARRLFVRDLRSVPPRVLNLL